MNIRSMSLLHGAEDAGLEDGEAEQRMAHREREAEAAAAELLVVDRQPAGREQQRDRHAEPAPTPQAWAPEEARAREAQGAAHLRDRQPHTEPAARDLEQLELGVERLARGDDDGGPREVVAPRPLGR